MEELSTGALSFRASASWSDMNQLIKWKLVIGMRKIQEFIQIIIAGTFVALIAACGTVSNNAPVVDRIDKGSKDASNSAAPAKNAGQSTVDLRTNYVVKKGDTLYRIALDHGQSYSDIVAWNNLKNPNDIKVDQMLRVAPTDASNNLATQTASVSTNLAIEVRNLSSLNPSINKTIPKGDKRPYSEANFLELQKIDSSPVISGTVNPKGESPPMKSLERTPSQLIIEQDAVDWIWPTEGKVVGNFDDTKNKGLDIAGKLGQDVFAASAGKVMYEGSGIRGYGNLVIIKHTNNLLSAYAHNKVNIVKEGQTINKGQKIAEMGNSDSDAVKLHFEIRQQGKPVDPSKFLPGR